MKLKDISNIRTGLVLARKKATLDDEKHFYRQITLKSFSNSITLESQYLDDFISVEEIDPTYLSQFGDIVVRLREPNTAVYIDEASSGLLIPSLMVIVRVHDKRVNNEFLAHFLNSKEAKKALEKELKGTTISMIKTKDLENLEVVLPSLKEQDSVVALMKLFEKEHQLLDALKAQKQHLSQTILDTIIKQNKDKN